MLNMPVDTLTQSQRSEQLLIDCAFGWLKQKVEAHHLRCPENEAKLKELLDMLKRALMSSREELCQTTDTDEFAEKVEGYRNGVTLADRILTDSKAIIIADRTTRNLFPVWPEELEWR
ncbi:hypothetical protein CAEBREN_04461 [Caenorhabditis brenneri]|uniref:Uncharacterized protein n=1 Tax=Caenorhabditis brenneri TaxID=135651 RepID=G0MQJ0_CAEBE|nr:hypothetical protein CAEBREN_04461 [Caenorhabditis brenneri]